MTWDNLLNYTILAAIFGMVFLAFMIIKKWLFALFPWLKNLRMLTLLAFIGSLNVAVELSGVAQTELTNYVSFKYVIFTVWFFVFFNVFHFADTMYFEQYLKKYKNFEIPQLLRNLIKFLVTTFFLFLLIREAVPSLSLKSYLASLGVMSVIIGLALQSAFSDIFAGIVIAINAPVKVRDWVKIDDFEGEVVEINWYSTKIRSINHDHVIFPNGKLLQSALTNYSRPIARERVDIDIGVSYATRPEQMDSAVKEALIGVKHIDPKTPVEILLKDYGDFAITYTIRLFIEHKKYLAYTRDHLYRNMYYVFARYGIEIPFPIRTVYMRQEPAPEIPSPLPKFDFFSFLDDAAFARFAAIGTTRAFGRGEYILQQGEEGKGIYVVVQGNVDIVRDGVTLVTVGAGAVLGEMSLVKKDPVSADCIMKSEGRVYFVEKRRMFGYLKETPEFMEQLGEMIARRQVENSQKEKSHKERETLITKEKKRIIDQIFKLFEE